VLPLQRGSTILASRSTSCTATLPSTPRSCAVAPTLMLPAPGATLQLAGLSSTVQDPPRSAVPQPLLTVRMPLEHIGLAIVSVPTRYLDFLQCNAASLEKDSRAKIPFTRFDLNSITPAYLCCQAIWMQKRMRFIFLQGEWKSRNPMRMSSRSGNHLFFGDKTFVFEAT
jgi:hypothetical protein